MLEGAIAIIEIIALFGFSYPVWTYRVNEVPDSRDAVNIRVIAQQFAWNIHYPGADGVFGRTDINLVDEVGNFYDAIDDMGQALKLDEPEVIFLRTSQPGFNVNWINLLFQFLSQLLIGWIHNFFH